MAYVADIEVGNPPQKVTAMFDTGSTNTWILNKNLIFPENKDGKRGYNPLESSSF